MLPGCVRSCFPTRSACGIWTAAERPGCQRLLARTDRRTPISAIFQTFFFFPPRFLFEVSRPQGSFGRLRQRFALFLNRFPRRARPQPHPHPPPFPPLTPGFSSLFNGPTTGEIAGSCCNFPEPVDNHRPFPCRALSQAPLLQASALVPVARQDSRCLLIRRDLPCAQAIH